MEISSIIGVDVATLKTLTINEFNSLAEGYLRRTEDNLNHQLQLNHQLGMLIGIAINQPKDYPKDAGRIEIEHIAQSEEEKEQQRLEKLKQTALTMWGMV